MILGVAGDLLTADEARSHYLTKVGGSPWIPAGTSHADNDNSSWEKMSSCGSCGRPMSLVLQELPTGECPDRVLLLLGCAHPGCGTSHSSWRAFRCQLTTTQPPQQTSPAPKTAPSAQATTAGGDVNSLLTAGPATATATDGGSTSLSSAGAPPSGPISQPTQIASQPQNCNSSHSSYDPFAGGFGGGDDGGFGFGFGFGTEASGFGAGSDLGGFTSAAVAATTGPGAGGGGGGGGGNKPSGGAVNDLDFSDLGAVLEHCAMVTNPQQAQQKQPQKKPKQPQEQLQGRHPAGSSGNASESACCTAGSRQLLLRGPPLPEFHIEAVEEPAEPHHPRQNKDLEHVRQLLEEYQRHGASDPHYVMLQGNSQSARSSSSGSSSFGAAAAAAAAPPLTHGSQPTRECGDGREGSDSEGEEGVGEGGRGGAGTGRGAAGVEGGEGECWAGEKYEEDRARGLDAAYLKFAARLARYPEQCARYTRGGKLLWPARPHPQPPPCPHCAAPRVFELQLMPPLAAMVLDCANWLVGRDLDAHRAAINAAANWDFASVAVFTCGRNCCGGVGVRGGGAGGGVAGAAGVAGGACMCFVEEYVAVVNEEECHVEEELKLGR